MEIRKIQFKKSIRFLTLLLTAMIIATASASVYYSLTWQPKVTVTAIYVKFTSGSDTPAGSTVVDSWARLLLKSYPNATLTYDEGVNISNTDTSDHLIRLRHVSITPAETNWDIGNFTRIKFYLICQNGTEATTFEYTTSGGNSWNEPSTTGYYLMPDGEEWTIKVETLSPATATAGKEADIQIALDIQG